MQLRVISLRGCLVLAIAASFCLQGCTSAYVKAPDSCPDQLDSPISRFCQVTKNVLWRGARPDQGGAAWLIEHGVKTIVNLELLNDDLAIIEQLNITTPRTIKIEYFRVKDWEPLPALAPAVEDEHVVHFLAIASQQASQPVYVHCRSGQNRTGIMVAAYRIVIEGQPNIDAVIDEMMAYQGFWSEVDATYLRGLSLRRSDILKKIEEKISRLEKPAQIICQNGKCAVAL